MNGFAVNGQLALARLDRALKAPVNAVVAKQHGQLLRLSQVVDRHHVKFARPLHHGPEHQSANQSKPVDTHFHCHRTYSC